MFAFRHRLLVLTTAVLTFGAFLAPDLASASIPHPASGSLSSCLPGPILEHPASAVSTAEKSVYPVVILVTPDGLVWSCGNDPVNNSDPTGLQSSVPRLPRGIQKQNTEVEIEWPLIGSPGALRSSARADVLLAEAELARVAKELENLSWWQIREIRKEMAKQPGGHGRPTFLVNSTPEGQILEAEGNANYARELKTRTSALQNRIQSFTNPERFAKEQKQVDQLLHIAKKAGPPSLEREVAESEMVTVRTYTGAAGREGITSSGVLDANRTWVTLPGEIPSRAGHLQIEKILEIQPGRGSSFLDFETPASNLRVPANGPRTSGGALQFRINEDVPIDPSTFRRPPGRPGG